MVIMRFCATVDRRHFDVVRGTLIGLQARGETIRAHESRGWLSRHFWIEGHVHGMARMQCVLKRVGAKFE